MCYITHLKVSYCIDVFLKKVCYSTKCTYINVHYICKNVHIYITMHSIQTKIDNIDYTILMKIVFFFFPVFINY